MSLYMASPNAYKLMRTKYRLPGVSTLKERCRRIVLKPRVVTTILPLLEKMDKRERVCCLYFDEMKVEEVPALRRSCCLASMSKFCCLRYRKTGHRILFQSAIIVNVNGLRILHGVLVEEYGEHHVLTRFLNQDPVERFFGTMPYKGCEVCDHPTPMTFIQRLRACILGKLITNVIKKLNLHD